MTTRDLGQEGFRWWIGVVEDREDPQKLGRLRVRIYNTHSPKQSRVTTTDLPWATVMSPITAPTNNKIGVAPVGITKGTTVVGFFADGEDGNNPIIMGTLAGMPGNNINNHDVPPEAREINTIAKAQLGPEPASAYRAKYPYNKVLRTESGHVIEIDDTPNFERIHVYHKSGTYIEVNETGRMVTKTADDSLTIVSKNNSLFVSGDVVAEVKGNINLTVGGTVTGKASSWNITGDVSVKGNVSVTGNINASGDISDKGRSMSSERAIYNSHVHADPQGGTVTPPIQSM